MNCSPEMSCFRSLQSLLLPQFATYRHRTGFIMKRKLVRMLNSLRKPIKKFLKICYSYSFCSQKKYAHFKTSMTFIIHYNLKKSELAILIYLLNAMTLAISKCVEIFECGSELVVLFPCNVLMIFNYCELNF